MLLVYFFTGRGRVRTLAKVLLCVGTMLSLCPLLGIRYYSVVGRLISAALAAGLALLHFAERQD